MAAKKNPNNTLPQTVDTDSAPSSTITYANEVVAIIAGLAANEVEGPPMKWKELPECAMRTGASWGKTGMSPVGSKWKSELKKPRWTSM